MKNCHKLAIRARGRETQSRSIKLRTEKTNELKNNELSIMQRVIVSETKKATAIDE